MTDNICYIGVDDLDLKLFENQYQVPHGMSYNSYLILDERIAIMDTCDARKENEWLHTLQTALNGRQPSYLVCHHMEPDHSSLAGKVMHLYPELKLVLSAQAKKMFPNFLPDCDYEDRMIVVKEGDTLSLGSHVLQFIAAPMVHWPEVIMSYEQTEKVLFSADAFGTFGALQFADEEWTDEARRYYFNICGKYGPQVLSAMRKISALEIAAIAPLHGPALKDNASEALKLYKTWSSYEPETNGVLVTYASIYGGTARAAEKLADILASKGASPVRLLDLCTAPKSLATSEAFRHARLCLCASSYDAGVFPAMHDFLHHLQTKNFQKRRVGLVENGSWAPTAGRVMRSMIENMKDCTIVEPMVTIRSRMKEADIPALEALATAILA